MKIAKKWLSLLLFLTIIVGILTGCDADGADTDKTFQEIQDFEQAKIGIMTGSSHDNTVRELFPDAERSYFNTVSDMVIAVQQGKIDCYIEDSPFLSSLYWENINVVRLDEPVKQVSNGFAFPQNEDSRELREQLNEFIVACKADGTIDELTEKWLGKTEPSDHPDYTALTGENGTIRLAVSVENKPMTYLRDNRFTGFEIDLLTRFAQQYGYAFEIETLPFESLLAGIAAGRYDMAAASLNITPEREESVDFSESYSQFDVVLVVAGDVQQQPAMTLADIENATIGIVTGTIWDIVAQNKFPNAERVYFNSSADVILALEQGKVDVFFADHTVFSGMRWEGSNLTDLGETVDVISNALILAKSGYDEALLAQLNAFISQSKNDGTLAALEEKWFGDEEPTEHPDYTQLTGENGTLKIAVGNSMKPTAYQRGALYTGFEVDFLTLFAEEYGYKLDMQGMAFEALIPAVASGKCDIGAAGITITPERAESVTFTDPHFETYGVAVVYSDSAADSDNKTLADFENATIGIQTGTVFDDFAIELFPNAERQYYSLLPDLILAVEQGKIDGYISEETYVTAALWEGANIKTVDGVIAQTEAGYIVQKSDEAAMIREQLNAFIIQAKESGMLYELQEKWSSAEEPTDFFDPDLLTGENGTLKVAISPDLKPLSYVKDSNIVGYEVELLQLFAQEYGYNLEFVPMTFDAILPGVLSGRYDIGAGGMTITEERAQSVDFTESYLTVDVVMVVSGKENVTVQPGFWDEVRESFNKTFIREDRWKLIVEGVGVTMLISVSAAVCGSLLGFGLYMSSRSEAKPLRLLTNGVAKVYSRIIEGTPIVVILMILFYVVFGRFRDMSGVIVAIIGFTLTFGAFVYDHMTVSVGNVDRGQTEAAYALGYTKNKTFFRIIFPQAMSIFLPSYCGQAVELIKATAVVGYVAVNDLTKMGDIIRSNTYEAFFPLIATAVIYFLLTWLLSSLLKLVKLRFEPKRRSREDILKGVKTV